MASSRTRPEIHSPCGLGCAVREPSPFGLGCTLRGPGLRIKSAMTRGHKPGSHPGLDPGSIPLRPRLHGAGSWIADQVRNDTGTQARLSSRTRSGIHSPCGLCCTVRGPGLRIKSATTRGHKRGSHPGLDPGSIPLRPRLHAAESCIANQARNNAAFVKNRFSPRQPKRTTP